MAHNLTNYTKTKLLEHSVGKKNWTAPTATFAALYLTSPTEDGGGEEVSEGSYFRQSITWNYASAEIVTNQLAIPFPIATSDWGTITAIGVTDGAVGGNLLWFGPIDVPRHVQINDVFQIDVDEISLTFT